MNVQTLSAVSANFVCRTDKMYKMKEMQTGKGSTSQSTSANHGKRLPPYLTVLHAAQVSSALLQHKALKNSFISHKALKVLECLVDKKKVHWAHIHQ
jgi:hypothetical protein